MKSLHSMAHRLFEVPHERFEPKDCDLGVHLAKLLQGSLFVENEPVTLQLHLVLIFLDVLVGFHWLSSLLGLHIVTEIVIREDALKIDLQILDL